MDERISSLDNSYEAREKRSKVDSEEKLAPIVKRSDVIVKKEGIGKKVKKAFISDDAKDVTSYIIFDVLVPGIKDGIFATLERMFYGGGSYYSSRRDDRDSYYGRERTSYSSYYKRGRDRDRRDRDYYDDRDRRTEKVDYRNIVIRIQGPRQKDVEEAKEKAEDIVKTLRNYIHDYDSVPVARLLDLIGVAGEYTDNNIGWTRESDIGMKRVRDGYLIDVPEAEWIV